jgi:hypothetical protein
MPVREACDAFLADVEAQRLSESSLRKYRVLLINTRKPKYVEKHSPSLSEFCAETGIQFTSQVLLPQLTLFRGQWKDGAIAGGKKLERLRAFGRFLVDRGWWPENLALKLKRPKVTDPPTMPYTRDEISALLSACAKFVDWRGQTDQENAHRLRAFILFLRYCALRIGDATSCPVDRLVGSRIFLYTQKTEVPVFIPLPPFVVDALHACPRKSERYWFWTGVGSKDTLAGNWRRTFRPTVQNRGRAEWPSTPVPRHSRGGVAPRSSPDGTGLYSARPLFAQGHRAPLCALGSGPPGATRGRRYAGMAQRSGSSS